MATSTKILHPDGRGATVITLASSNHATAAAPTEPPRVRFSEDAATVHTYEREIGDDPAKEAKRDLRLDAVAALKQARAALQSPEADPAPEDTTDTTCPRANASAALEKARNVMKASDDIEAKWKAFQNAFDTMNKLLIANIGENMMQAAEREKKHHEIIDIKMAIKMVRECSKIVILTGAGISVASGLPTYRGNDGVWTKSSKNYTPEEIATLRVFEEDTEWSWEYYRGVAARCESVKPNAGHAAIAALQEHFEGQEGKTFQLITTNIDDLHRRAGSRDFFELHGNVTQTRCTNVNCQGSLIRPMPAKMPGSNIPRCQCCGEATDTGLKPPLRPHILWFDEGYTEELHSIKSVFKAVEGADLMITIGGTCTTGGPRRMLQKAHDFDVPVIDINPQPNNDICEVKLLQLVSTGDEALPKIVKALQKGQKQSGAAVSRKAGAKKRRSRRSSTPKQNMDN